MRGGKNRRGFTIVELLLATAIFSTVLMVVIAGFLQIGRLFYKGVTLTNTQQIARQIVDNVSNDIRFNPIVPQTYPPITDADLDATGNPPNDTENNIGYYCIGNARYTFHLYHLVGNTDNYTGHSSDFGLIRDQLNGATGCDNPYKSGSGNDFNQPKELLSPGMRIKNFQVTQESGGQVYNVTLDLISGDNISVQFDSNHVPSCNANSKASQYCAETQLSTSVSVNTGALNSVNNRQNGLTVKKAGTGYGTVTLSPGDPGTLNCGGTCQVIFDNPTTVNMIATPRADSTFKNWSFNKTISCAAGNNKTPCKVSVEGGVYVTATFKCSYDSCDYTLNVSNNGDGLGSVTGVESGTTNQVINCGSTCSKTYDTRGKKVTLTATANSTNSTFTRWKGASGCNTSTTCDVTLTQAVSVKAYFKCNSGMTCSFDITVNKNGTGSGTVQSTPDPGTDVRKIDCGQTCNASFTSATTINLTAIPDDNSTFAGWKRNCVNGDKTSNPCTVNVDDSINWTATFSKK